MTHKQFQFQPELKPTSREYQVKLSSNFKLPVSALAFLWTLLNDLCDPLGKWLGSKIHTASSAHHDSVCMGQAAILRGCV